MMVCAVCRTPVGEDMPLGYVHEDGKILGPDGHRVVAVAAPPGWSERR